MKTHIFYLIGGIVLLFILYLRIGFRDSSNESISESPTNADQYFKYRKQQISGGTGRIPADGLVKAKQHIQNMGSTRDAGLWEWEWLGPTNIGGRTRHILINPWNDAEIWLSTENGGIWKSEDAGESWQNVNDFMSTLAVSSIVFDPANTDILYAATGFYSNYPGNGIFKSIDAGDTWNQLPSTNNADFTSAHRMVAHPNSDSAGIIYVGTMESKKLFKTTDGGNSWDTMLITNSGIRDIDIDENNSDEIAVGCMGDLYNTHTLGQIWIQQNVGGSKLPTGNYRCEFSFCPSNGNRYYAFVDINNGEVWRSDNEGLTWYRVFTGENILDDQGTHNMALWVDPDNSDNLLIGGIDVWKSTDGGYNLEKISDWTEYHNGANANSLHADQHFICPTPGYHTTTNPAVYFANDGGIQMTSDVWSATQHSGWVNLANTTLGITQFIGGAITADGSLMIGGTQDNDVVRYKKTGSWSGIDNWFQSETGDGGYCAIDPNNTDIMYSEYIYLYVEKSIDGGDTYHSAITGLLDAQNKNKTRFYSPLIMDPNNSSALVAGGESIWRTINGAANWVLINGHNATGSICSSLDIAVGNSNLIWAGYDDGLIYKTQNNSVNDWIRVDPIGGPLPNRVVSDISINPNNNDEVFVTFTGYSNDNVWFTDDAGATWQNRSGTAPNDLPELPVHTVRHHKNNSNWIYIGTHLGVFASEDKGITWSVTAHFGDNEGPANTEISELFWQGDEFLIAATQGRGMFRTATPTMTILVDHNAPTGGNGSQSHPFQKVVDATHYAGPGTTILIESGTYDEGETILFQRRGYIVNRNGNVIFK